MQHFATFNFEKNNAIAIVIEHDKHYKIYRERLRELSNLKNLDIVIITKYNKKYPNQIKTWLVEDKLNFKVVEDRHRIKKKGLATKILGFNNLLNEWMFGQILSRRFPSGHNLKTSQIIETSKFKLFLVQTFSKLVNRKKLWMVVNRLKTRGIANETASILKNSDLVICTFIDQSRPWQLSILDWCSRNKIETSYLVASWDNLTNRVPLPFRVTDSIITWSEWQAKQAVELWCYSPSNAYIYDPKVISKDLEKYLVNRLHRSEDLRTVFQVRYLGSSEGVVRSVDEVEILRELIDHLEEFASECEIESIAVEVRVHPLVMSQEGRNQYSMLRNKTNVLCNITMPVGQSGLIFKEDDLEELAQFLFGADVVIGINTSLMIDAQALGIPVVALPLEATSKRVKHNFHFMQLKEIAIFECPDNYKSFFEVLNKIVSKRFDQDIYQLNSRRFLGHRL
jgi:hypothetical protein